MNDTESVNPISKQFPTKTKRETYDLYFELEPSQLHMVTEEETISYVP